MFTLFQMLPTEIRLMIWRAAHHERRVTIDRNHRSRLNVRAARFLLVNFESNEEFRRVYKRCFDRLGQKHVMINPAKDTVNFVGGLKAFCDMCCEYPDSMSMIKYVEIRPWRFEYTMWNIPDVRCFASTRKITVSFPKSRNYTCGANDLEAGFQIYNTLQQLRNFIDLCTIGKNRPTLAAVFAPSSDYLEPLYLESSSPNTASYGVICNFHVPGSLRKPLSINWLKKEVVWTSSQTNCRLYPNLLRARIRRTRHVQLLRDSRMIRTRLAHGRAPRYLGFSFHICALSFTSWNTDGRLSSVARIAKEMEDFYRDPFAGVADLLSGTFLSSSSLV